MRARAPAPRFRRRIRHGSSNGNSNVLAARWHRQRCGITQHRNQYTEISLGHASPVSVPLVSIPRLVDTVSASFIPKRASGAMLDRAEAGQRQTLEGNQQHAATIFTLSDWFFQSFLLDLEIPFQDHLPTV
jgi:hypothetical protein